MRVAVLAFVVACGGEPAHVAPSRSDPPAAPVVVAPAEDDGPRSTKPTAPRREIELSHVLSGGYPLDVIYMQRHQLERCLGTEERSGPFRIEVARDGAVKKVRIDIPGVDVACMTATFRRMNLPQQPEPYVVAATLEYH